MDEPIEPPLPAPLTPPQKQCPDCKGAGTLVAWLGETKPCEKCAGTGVIEVAEEKLSPWQQKVVALLTRIADTLDYFRAYETAMTSDLGAREECHGRGMRPLSGLPGLVTCDTCKGSGWISRTVEFEALEASIMRDGSIELGYTMGGDDPKLRHGRGKGKR